MHVHLRKMTLDEGQICNVMLDDREIQKLALHEVDNDVHACRISMCMTCSETTFGANHERLGADDGRSGASTPIIH